MKKNVPIRTNVTSVAAAVAVTVVSLATTVLAADPGQWARENVGELVPLYKHLHRNPELSFQEEETAARLALELRELGIEVTTGVGGTGVVGVLENGDGKRLLIRTDLDALPVREQTGLPYASEVTVENPTGSGTVGSIRGGSKHNIISDECQLLLTVRSYSQDVRKQIREAIRRKANGVAMAAGAPEPVVKVTEGTDAVYNHLDLVERLVPVFRDALGEENVVEADQTMGAEDFGLFARGGVPRRRISQAIKSRVKRVVQFVSGFESRVLDYARQHRCDAVVCGHIHMPQLREEHGVLYADLGTGWRTARHSLSTTMGGCN